MTKRQIDKLLKLAAFLRDLPREKFDMELYCSGFSLDKSSATSDCGTTACIAGWSTLFFPSLEISRRSGGVVERDSLGRHRSDIDSTTAISRAWGMSRDDVEELCAWDAPHRTPKAAARALEKIVAKYADAAGYEIIEE